MTPLPINHLKATLDRCCGQWEFRSPPNGYLYCIRFLNTGEEFTICLDAGTWTAFGGDLLQSPFLTNRLNGISRDDDGCPLMETPDKETAQ